MIVPLVQSVSHSLSDVMEMACGVGSTVSWPGKAWLCLVLGAGGQRTGSSAATAGAGRAAVAG